MRRGGGGVVAGSKGEGVSRHFHCFCSRLLLDVGPPEMILLKDSMGSGYKRGWDIYIGNRTPGVIEGLKTVPRNVH